jgi:hypothetical protein
MTVRCVQPRRRGRRELFGLGVLALGLLAGPPAQAQGEAVGSIEEIRRGRTPVDSTASVRLTASPAYARKPARQRDALHLRELVELLEPYYVRVNLERGATRTRVYAGSSGARIGEVELQRRGAYEILPDRVDPLSGLELRIRHGVLVIEHAAGRLDAWAGGTLMRIRGTTALVAVDSTQAEALCFLREGHIEFPEHEMDSQGRYLAWRLREGFAPERIILSAPQQRRLVREVEHLSSGVWRGPRPFYQRPGFYIPVGAAVIGGGILLLTSRDDRGRVSGDVIVEVPW